MIKVSVVNPSTRSVIATHDNVLSIDEPVPNPSRFIRVTKWSDANQDDTTDVLIHRSHRLLVEWKEP